MPDEEWLDEESLLKKLLRDDEPPPEPPWLLPDEELRGGHSAALLCSSEGCGALGGRLAALARHQRVGGAADRKRAHQQQRDMAGALRRGGWPWRAGTETGLRLPNSLLDLSVHGQ